MEPEKKRANAFVSMIEKLLSGALEPQAFSDWYIDYFRAQPSDSDHLEGIAVQFFSYADDFTDDPEYPDDRWSINETQLREQATMVLGELKKYLQEH